MSLIMKRVLSILASVLVYISCFSQIRTGIKDNVTYIVPTIENFITLCNCSESEFVSYMKRYNYSEENSNAKWISYSASLDNFLVHAVVNFDYAYGGNSIISWLPKGEIYPSNAVSNMYRKLRPHYLRMEEQSEVFAFNYRGKAYGVMIQNCDKAYIIRVICFGTSDSRLSVL